MVGHLTIRFSDDNFAETKSISKAYLVDTSDRDHTECPRRSKMRN